MARHQPLLVEILEHPILFFCVLTVVFLGMGLASERVQAWWWQYRILRDLRRKRRAP